MTVDVGFGVSYAQAIPSVVQAASATCVLRCRTPSSFFSTMSDVELLASVPCLLALCHASSHDDNVLNL